MDLQAKLSRAVAVVRGLLLGSCFVAVLLSFVIDVGLCGGRQRRRLSFFLNKTCPCVDERNYPSGLLLF